MKPPDQISRSVRFVLALSLAAFGGPFAWAYGIAPYSVGNLSYLDSQWYYTAIQNQNIVNAIDRDARSAKNSPTSKAEPVRTIAPATGSADTTATPKKMAATYPAASQAEAERVFREMLSGYAKIEQQFDIPRHDVAGAIAAFVAGSYMAYRNTDFPDEYFKPLVNQMRQIVGGNPDFAKASAAEKRAMYEQMAILGMFMATTQMALKEKPNPQIAANLKQAAKDYLEKFLKADAERAKITANGLELK